jgi:hypothetical protein
MNSTVSQTVIINGLQSILEFKPNSDMKLFKSLIDCSSDNLTLNDINSLRRIKLFNDDLLFESISTKCHQLILDNQLKDTQLSELNSQIRTLNEENRFYRNESMYWYRTYCYEFNRFK